MACSSASSAKSVRMDAEARHPTIRREKTSTTNATSTNPRHVATNVNSATHS
jgi:hypothetical protein